MCDWGDTVNVEVTIPADLSHTSKARKAVKPIDRCIAPLVAALEKQGIVMRSSCCGHGKGVGVINLNDSRVCIVRGDYSAMSFDWEGG